MTSSRLLLTLAVALAPAAATAQPQMPQPGFLPPGFAPPPNRTISYTGYEVFKWLLHRADLKPLTDNELWLGPNGHTDYVVVVLGSPQHGAPANNSTRTWIDRALAHGGAVLVANDQFATLAPNNFPAAHVSFTQWRVAAGEAVRFANRPDAPFADPRIAPGPGGPEWDLFGGDRPLTRVATINPGSIHTPPQNGQGPAVLAGFPRGSVIANSNRPASPDFVFAVGKSDPQPWNRRPYRFLALADQAVFQNGPMISGDEKGQTDNLEFAERVTDYLTSTGGGKKRTKCLLVVNGQVVSNYDELTQLLRPPLPLPKLPPWNQMEPKLVDLGNQLIDRIQEKDVPNQMIVGPHPDRPNSWLRTILGLALTAAALWASAALVRRVWGARHPTDVATPPPGGRPPPPKDGGAGVFGRRGKELAARDNVLEPARAACRDFFDAIGGPPDPGPRLPKVVISDVVRRPETLRQALRDLWAVAYGRPTPVTAARWAVLEPLIPRALAAHRDGKWRFVEGENWGVDPIRPRGEA